MRNMGLIFLNIFSVKRYERQASSFPVHFTEVIFSLLHLMFITKDNPRTH